MSKSMKDEGRKLANARDAFFGSEEGKSVLSGGASGVYLKNRIEIAFISGWNARTKEEIRKFTGKK